MKQPLISKRTIKYFTHWLKSFIPCKIMVKYTVPLVFTTKSFLKTQSLAIRFVVDMFDEAYTFSYKNYFSLNKIRFKTKNSAEKY